MTAAISPGLAAVPVWLGGVAGDEEAGRAEAEGLGIEDGGGDAGGFGDGQVGVVADGDQLLALAAEEGGVGRVADVLDREAEADGGGGLAQPGAAHGLEELGAVAEEDGRRGDGIPEDVAEAAQGGAVGGTAGSLGAMASQSAARAWSAGAPMRSRRSAEGGMAPE